MKPFFKNLLRILFIILIAAAFGCLGFFFNKFGLEWLKPTALVEQIPFEEDLEITGFEEAEFYNSTNEFIGAEIRIKVKFISHIIPVEKLPSEYKKGIKKAYSIVDIHVKDIPSKEALEKMKEALADSKYLKLIKNKEIQAIFVATKINNKKLKSIEKITVKPESYYFVKY